MNRFLKHFLIASSLGLLGLPILTWVVDPLGGFHNVRIPGFNANKPAAVSPKRETKALWVKQIKPDAIFLGSSRVLLGLDPAHPALKNYRAFNFGITDAQVSEIAAQLKYAQKTSPLRIAIIGLDFHAFNALDQETQKTSPFLDLPRWQQIIKIMWSLESLEFTGKTLGRQSVKPKRWLEKNGLMKADTQALNLSGRNDIFASMTSQYRPNNCSYALSDTKHSPLSTLSNIMDYAHQQNIQIYLHIPPVHAWLTEALYAQGLGNEYRVWVTELVRINEASAARNSHAPFPLWDFSGYNSVTTEALPAPGSRNKMRNYYDGSHYLPKVGEAMLNKMFNQNNSVSNFGKSLHSANLADHFLENERQRTVFLTSKQAQSEKHDFDQAIRALTAKRRQHCAHYTPTTKP